MKRTFAALLVAGVVFGGSALAHPMGNLSVNHYAKLQPGANGIDVTYVLDLAEIPTFELTQTWHVAKDAVKPELDAKAEQQARKWAHNLSFTEDGKPLNVTFVAAELGILEGAGNLPVFRIASTLHVAAKGGRVEYEDRNYPSRAGWREIVIHAGAGASVAKASRPDTELSEALTAYPQDPTKAPPQDTKAWMEWKPLAGPVSKVEKPIIVAEAAAPVVEPKRDVRPPEQRVPGTVQRNDAISRLLRIKDISWPVMLTLMGLAFWFGALHALEPGHGKTMVAAYLVGERGTPKHALLLGGMVTFTHTVSVFLLGVATMFLSRYIMPDKISQVLGVVSGVSIVWIGLMLLWKRWHNLQHHHHHHHSHHGHAHPHTHSHSHVPEGDISMKGLMALGASGGLVPCPSALILLLSAISIGRTALGMTLLVSFSLGLAVVLSATGLAVLYAKNLFPERRRRARSRVLHYMPVFSAAAILLIGVMMTSVSLGLLPATRFFG